MSASFAEVLLDVPLGGLDYAVPSGMHVQVGDRVVVPLASRKLVGIVSAVRSQSSVPIERIREVLHVFDDVRPLSQEWMQFLSFAADYYVRFRGEAAVPTLPPFFRSSPRAQYARSLEKLRQLPKKRVKASPAPELNDEQRAAVEAIAHTQGFATHVLFGVTGSGKTEVYLHCIAHALERHAQAQVLLLVPEINLTPQLEARVRGRFAQHQVVTLHSGLTPAQRARSWLAVHEGRARILVGTRMAIFASFEHLELIIVDEEHDASYKAGEAMRFSARDLAIKRAKDNNVACVLGSATPSLETWAKVRAGQYRCLRLSARAVASAHMPKLEVVDVSQEKPDVFSPRIQAAIDEALAAGEQVLVFINRRGYAPVISCSACGWVSCCTHCSGFTVFHKSERRLICHHCGSAYAVPVHCPKCGNPELVAVGTGTQRIEEAIAAYWPQARLLRIDRDSVRSTHAAHKAFESVHAGDVDIIVGTQMIAKGHDFKRVGLVVVLNADAQLVSPNVRAQEQLFATLMQVAGRAGRDRIAGRVLIQTRYPTHPIYADMLDQNFERFADRLLESRREAMSPPFIHQALLTAQSPFLDRTLAFLQRARARALALGFERIFIYDPVPMPLMRLKDSERGQLLIETLSRAERHAFLSAWDTALRAEGHPEGAVGWSIEVDPMDV